MARTAIATLQTVWDCHWSRPGHRLTGVEDALQPESRWVCVRDGHRRAVDEEECESCAYWETSTETIGVNRFVAEASTAAAASVPDRATQASPAWFSGRLLNTSTRALLIVTAALFAVSGFVSLTSPLMIPVTVTPWLGAAVLAGTATFGRLGDYGSLITPDAD